VGNSKLAFGGGLQIGVGLLGGAAALNMSANPPENGGNTSNSGSGNNPILNEINELEAAIEDATQGLAEAEAGYQEAIAAGDFETAQWLAQVIEEGQQEIQALLDEYNFWMGL
jgi:flagellar biosynthesis/type III secretory pathway protein FliH